MKSLNGIVRNMTDQQLEEAYFEIKEFRQAGVLQKGVVRKIHDEYQMITEYEQNIRTVEDAILFEIARRMYE